ncbi:MAG: PKD domain-containing protein, partial [Bacteroidales bacterium]|nr:PKD domain-containing protein [Bacteroidales bacterium]
FGDGITSTEQNPTHEYTEDGEYLVSLTIETDDCSSTTEYYVWIGDNTWYPEECMAIFWAEYNQEDYFTVQFNDLSWGAGNEILSWDWNFGDGTESTEQNPSHTYTEEGEYLVSLTIHSDSCTSTFIEVVYIEDWGNSNGDFCGAFFIPEFIENSLSVQFYDLSIPIPESWTWNFGDGSTNTEQNPLHEYADSGIYIVTLTTQNIGNDSCIGTFEMEIYVHQNNGGIVKSFATGPSGITGIPNTTNKISPNISLYPNPVNDKLFIEIPNGIENAQVEIMNIAGQIILSQNFTNNKFYINTTELIQGLYIASIIIDGKRTNLKFIK